MRLSESKEHYIQAIYEENLDNQGARVSDLANNLGVSKASVSRAISSLEDLDLVYRNDKRQALLTELGTEQAVLLADRFYIIKGFLEDVLKVSPQNAFDDACALEHLISYETLASMATTLKSEKAAVELACNLEECPWPKAENLFYKKQP